MDFKNAPNYAQERMAEDNGFSDLTIISSFNFSANSNSLLRIDATDTKRYLEWINDNILSLTKSIKSRFAETEVINS
ncbi:unnamed protein product [Gordionus sp. m RMFG-2023]